jgi:hypothetical protein
MTPLQCTTALRPPCIVLSLSEAASQASQRCGCNIGSSGGFVTLPV